MIRGSEDFSSKEVINRATPMTFVLKVIIGEAFFQM